MAVGKPEFIVMSEIQIKNHNCNSYYQGYIFIFYQTQFQFACLDESACDFLRSH